MTAAIALGQINLVVRDVRRSIPFYRLLGVAIEAIAHAAWAPHHANGVTSNGVALELDSGAFARQWNPGLDETRAGPPAIPFFHVGSPEEVDRIHDRIVAAGHRSHQAPTDAFWGARYAIVEDPDGRTVGIMTPVDDSKRRPPPAPPPLPGADTATLVVGAPPHAVFRAFAADAIMSWLPPAGMTGRAVAYDFRERGRFCIELSRIDSAGGKTTARTDVTLGRFLVVEPPKRIVQTVEFVSPDVAFEGVMTMTWTFEPAEGGTLTTVVAEDVPPGIAPDDHARGLQSSLENLARAVRA
jgi:uncharacterized protein YndB with AHSA1/START domain/uncharacterized glyoxalase superfamily protein PhnB